MNGHWNTDKILEIARGYQPASVLTAAAELNVFTVLHRRPMDAESLAGELATDLRATTILLDALVGMGLLAKRDAIYSVPADLAELLTESSPENILPMVRHTGACLRRWAQLTQTVKTGNRPEHVPGIRGQEGERAAFIGAMHNFSAPVAAEVVRCLGPLQFEHLLDVGGASGTWTIEFLKAVPNAAATLFDLPEVIPMAQQRISQAGLAERVTLVAGDFYTDALPAGADLAFLGAIAHQNSRPQNRELFSKVHAALRDGGLIVIRDVVMDSTHTSPPAGALFAVNMLVGTAEGGTYSFEEYTDDLEKCGFTDVTLVRRDEFMNSLIRAKKR